jgi:hypothetical protein
MNQRKDLLETVQDVKRAPEPEILMAALLELRKFERQHGLTPATIEGISEQDKQVLNILDKQAKEYRNQSNGA